jgi:hypothetical protein
VTLEEEVAMLRRFTRSGTGRGFSMFVVLVLALGTLAAPVSAAEDAFLTASMYGEEEVPGPGDESIYGDAYVDVYSESGEVCFTVFVEAWEGGFDLADVTAMHIHAGAAGVSGDPVVTFPLTIIEDPDFGNYFQDCIDGLDTELLDEIADDPESFYVNVHTGDFPAGAIRGQLTSFDLPGVEFSIAPWACPAGVDSTADVPFGTELDLCVPIIRSDRADELPDGFAFDPDPIVFDYAITLTDEFGDVLTEDNLVPYGEIDCDAASETCVPANGELFEDPLYGEPLVYPGLTVVEIGSAPAGHRFAFADAWTLDERGEEESAPVQVDVDVDVNDGEISLDTLEYSSIHMRIFFTPGSAPTPTPTATGSSAPTITLPPTASAGADAIEPNDAAPVLFVLLAISGLAAVSLSIAPRARRR